MWKTFLPGKGYIFILPILSDSKSNGFDKEKGGASYILSQCHWLLDIALTNQIASMQYAL